MLASCVVSVGLKSALLGRLTVVSDLPPLYLALLDDPVERLRSIELLLLDPTSVSVA